MIRINHQQKTTRTNSKESGLTLVETLVTLLIISLFLGSLIQAYITMESQRALVARRALASDIAYSNLRKFSSRPAALTCTGSAMDLTTPGTKAGSNLSSYFTGESLTSLGTGSSQTVVAFAPGGCNGDGTYVDTFPVVKIVSTVTYNGGSVSHATFVQ